MSLALKVPDVPYEDTNTDPKTKYEVLENLGEGVFGRVSKCCNRASKEMVALKSMKKKGEQTLVNFWRELEMLDCIKVLDPDIFNLVKFIEYFNFEDCQSLVFELLDMSVSDLLLEQTAFSLNQIRPMAKQMLVALQGLQSVGVMHTDIKPDNIMLLNHKEQPFKVKLIDFGVARCCDQVFTGHTIQPTSYRAPEVTLGLPLTEAVDVWSLACCLLLWCQESEDFLSSSSFDNMTKIVHFLGTPANVLLKKGLHTRRYFVPENNSWRLKTLQEFKTTVGINPEMSEDLPSASNLEELIKGSKAPQSDEESCDTDVFLDLVSKMLEIDAKKRISPTEALLHPFITMEPLLRETKYFNEAKELMCVAETHGPLQQESFEEIVERQKISTAPKEENIHIVPSFDSPDGANKGDAHDGKRKSPTQEEDNNHETTSEHVMTPESNQNASEDGEEDNCEVQQEEPDPALEMVSVLEALMEELPEDCNSKLLQEGGATEAELPKVSQKASRFTKLIPRPLRVFFSKLLKLLRPRPNKPFFKKLNGSNTSHASKGGPQHLGL